MDSLKVYLNDVQVARRIVKQAPLVMEKLSVRYPSACYARIVDGILRRHKQIAS